MKTQTTWLLDLPPGARAGLGDVTVGFHPVPPRHKIGCRHHLKLWRPGVNEVEVWVWVGLLIPLLDGIDHRGHRQWDCVVYQAGGPATNRVNRKAVVMTISEDHLRWLWGIEEPFQDIY